MLEMKANRDIKRQQAASEAAPNMSATSQMEAHERAMATCLAQKAMADALASGATSEEAIATGHAASEAVI